jgi:hypothetical protein
MLTTVESSKATNEPSVAAASVRRWSRLLDAGPVTEDARRSAGLA